MPAPLVSVVIPAYNASRHLGWAIRSALAQTHRRIEVVVVDDGSTDQTAAVARHFAARDARVRVIRQPNAGVAAARNLAIAASRGELVAPLDADDAWLPTKVEAQVRRLHEAGEGVGVVYTGWSRIDEAGRVTRHSRVEHAEGDVLHALVTRCFLGNASTPMFRRGCLDTVGGYDESMRARGGQGCEDWDLALRLAERCRFAAVPERLVHYRDAAGSMTRDAQRMLRSFDLMMQKLHARRPDVPARLIRASRARFALYLAKVDFNSGEKRRAGRGLLTALATDPRVVLSPQTVGEIAWGALGRLAGWPGRAGVGEAGGETVMEARAEAA